MYITGCSEGQFEPKEEFSALKAGLEGDPCVPPVSPIVINEFMANPEAVADINGEWIELYNPHGVAHALVGFTIESKNGNPFVFPDVTLKAGAYLILCNNSNSQFNGGVKCDLEWDGLSLNNDSDKIILKDPDGNEVDYVMYDAPQFSGKSTALMNPYLDNSYTSNLNFKSSSATYGTGDKGTPGAKNSDVYEIVEHPALCGDGKFCTYDLCEAGRCMNPWKEGCCELNSHCNDGNPCTEDICDTYLKKCANHPIAGCCKSNSDCVDDNPCNLDVCLFNTCRYPHYNVVPGCCYAPAKNPDTGQPWESETQKKKFADAMCGQPNNPCQKFSCNLTTNKCELSPPSEGCCLSGADCNDINPCSVDFCINGKCVYTYKPNCCWENSQCIDADICTFDICLFGLCRNFPKSIDGCCYEDKHCVKDPALGVSINSCVQDKCVNKQCIQVVKDPCIVKIPYLETFEIQGNWTSSGWKVVNLAGNASTNWKFVETAELGPDRFLKFHWAPGAMNVKSIFLSPIIDVSSAKFLAYDNKFGKVTVQWDNIYKHYHGSVNLSLVVVPNENIANAVKVWSASPKGNLAFDIISVTLPDHLVEGGSLQIGFMVETTSTYNLDSWSIDRVKVKASLPPVVIAGISDFVMSVDQSVVKTYKVDDPDHFTSPYVQTPKFYFQGSPLDHVPFATMLQTFLDYEGKFHKPVKYDPKGQENLVGIYNTAIVAQEGGGSLETVSLEGLHKFRITVLGKSGYLLWSPKGIQREDAVTLKEAIKQNGRAAQIIDDITIIKDFSKYSGIFALLGVNGRNHQLKENEIFILKQYLLSGGRLYLEGGDFFFSDPKNDLHPFFRVKGVRDPAARVSGPVVGTHFINPLEYNYSQDFYYNFAIDSIEAGGGKARTILINGSDGRGLAVANEEQGYRTIASSILFSGLSEKGTGQLKELAARYLLFLEHGFPACKSHAQCNDLNVCTTDSCEGGKCVNEEIPECKPCLDDSACPTKKGCHPAAGYCVNIPGALFSSADTPIVINKGNPVAKSTINIKKYGEIKDLHVKVSITHTYRGDLRLKLAHNGKEIILKKPNLGDSAKNVRATYDFIPVGFGSLDNFNGDILYGNWTLTVEDTEPVMNNGILKEWFIFAVYTPKPCPTGFVCDPDTGCVPGEVCKTYFRDKDGDGFGATFDNICVCEASPPYTALKGGDCNDNNANVNPDALEKCNGFDDDCDETADEAEASGCVNYFKDADSDSFGLTFDKQCLCSPKGVYSTTQYGDCNDYNALVNPAATELCNAIDDNCNYLIDDGISCKTKYCFSDGFEWGGNPGWSTTGLWHRIDAETTIKNIYAEDPYNYVVLPYKSYLAKPYEGMYAFWYGKNEDGSFINIPDQYQSEKSGGNSLYEHEGYLISPAIVLSAESEVILKFYTWWEIEAVNPAGYDLMRVLVSIDNGTTWNEVGRLNPSEDTLESPWKPLSNNGVNISPSWHKMEFDISEYKNMKVNIAFHFKTGDALYNGFRGWLIDNVKIVCE